MVWYAVIMTSAASGCWGEELRDDANAIVVGQAVIEQDHAHTAGGPRTRGASRQV